MNRRETLSRDGRNAENLPSALTMFEQITGRLGNTIPVVFLDYDGTLTPIVLDPGKAVLADAMRQLLISLSLRFTTAIISGRDLDDLKQFIRLDSVILAGSHGFDIEGPAGMRMQAPDGTSFIPELDRIEAIIGKELNGIDGVFAERKKFMLAIHYRNAESAVIPNIMAMIKKIAGDADGLRVEHGKKVIEFRPDTSWDKGAAVLWIMSYLKQTHSSMTAIYLGDDLTDEDAFRVLEENGISIVVGSHRHKTLAEYCLRDINEVKTFLRNLLDLPAIRYS